MTDSEEFCEGVLRMLRHDLRTPLAAMVSLADLMSTDPASPPSERQARMLRMMRHSGEQLLEMLATMQQYADLQGPMPPPGPVSLASVLREAVDGARALAERRGVGLELETPEPVQVIGRAAQMHAMLEHLLRNAIQHTPCGGVVRVQAVCAPDSVALSVWDEGPGFSLEELGRPFQRGPGSREPGAGLGLAIVVQVAQLHGGTVEAGGGRVQVTLPR